ncbi:hypothetical protein ACFQI7_36685 [Paenibacillus allorhizosphaerae]|uniref:Integron-associated effector binding protein domain-containing protein n=1 Tax=Paenibacillus allorhizosphaerae TaxID=2849866 RepID=A0ABM8VUF3_9BACL|nr:hypothetical protein [Paenibacillus allorhizosphaerae]CAG7658785.1 hypothetical protein PAECIP111802_07165 [Paenibacillus allorhizosphaerae]
MMIPTELDGAKVIQHTSNSMANHYGVVGILSDSKEILDQLPITAMAICQYEESNKYYLFSCDTKWEVIGDFDFDTLEDAVSSAKLSHNVNEDEWIII